MSDGLVCISSLVNTLLLLQAERDASRSGCWKKTELCSRARAMGTHATWVAKNKRQKLLERENEVLSDKKRMF
jgi:hypothetical protein